PLLRLNRDDSVVEAVPAQTSVRLDPGVGQGGVLIAAEGEHSLIHLGRIEDPKVNQEVEILHGQAGDGLEKTGLDLGDDVVEGVLAKIREVHERRDPGGELDEVLLDLLPLGLVLLLLLRQLLLLGLAEALTLLPLRAL